MNEISFQKQIVTIMHSRKIVWPSLIQTAFQHLCCYNSIIRFCYFYFYLLAVFLLTINLHVSSVRAENLPVGTIHGPPSLSCPSKDFSTFFDVFSDNIQVQQVFTVWPLKQSSVNALAEPEPAVVESVVNFKDAQFPLIEGKAYREENSIVIIGINKISSSNIEIQLGKEDTDFLVSYFFRLDSCWKLYRIDDHSL